MPIAAAFDGAASSSGNNYATDPSLGGLSEASDADVQVILELPCTMVLERYSVQAGIASLVNNNQSPSKMSVSGSNECTESGTWTEVGSFENEVTWTAEEIKTFSADATKGAFKCFQFTGKRLSQAANQRMLIGDLMLHGSDIDPDQCTMNTHDCHANATCNNTHGSFSCVCNDGWSGTGVSCANEDECSSNAHDCDANATCSDTTGSFACSCNAGFDGDGITACTNIDECSTGVHDCDTNANCTDTTGSFACSCNAGFSGTGTVCTNMDECTTSVHDCDANVMCTDTTGSFSCGCNNGYSGTGTNCTASACNEASDSVPNTLGVGLSRTDGGGQSGVTGSQANFTYACLSGYTMDGGNGTGTVLLTCTAAGVGSSSWQGTLPTCTGMDECSVGVHNCFSDGATCMNTAASFTCSCNEGYQGDGVTVCELTAGPVVAEICASNGTTPAADVTANYDGEIVKIQEWQTENAGRAGVADLGAAALEVLDGKLSTCLDIAPAEAKEQIAVDSATSTVETISTLLETMDSELSSATGSSSSSSSASSSSSSDSTSTLDGAVVVVSAPPVTEPTKEEKDKATETAIKLLTAVDNIADNLADAVPIGKPTIIKTPTLSIAIQSSPPEDTTMEAQSERTSVSLKLGDTDAIASTATTGAYEGHESWKAQRQSLPSTARSSSNAPKSLTLMESVVSPSPFAGERTRENGFVLAGLTPFIRLAARQGGEVIGAARVAVISSSSSSSRAAGGRSGRRLEDAEEGVRGEEGEAGITESGHKENGRETEEVRRKMSESTTTGGSNVATVVISSPEVNNILEHRELIESDWEAYGLGRQGGTWEVNCAQLDVQNEEWTLAGCVTLGTSGGEIVEDEITCECEIRAMEAVFIVSQRYIEPPESAPVMGQARGAVKEELKDRGFLFLFQTVSVASMFIFATLLVLVITAQRAERRLLPSLPDVPPPFSLCDCRRRRRERGGATRLKALRDQKDERGDEKGGNRRQKIYRKGKGERAEEIPSEGGQGVGVLGKEVEEETKLARALFASSEHATRIRKYLNPRRIIAFHTAMRGETGVSEGSETKPKKRGQCAKFTPLQPLCRCFRRVSRRELTLGCTDAPVLRSALRSRWRLHREASKGYLLGSGEEQRERQEQLWNSMKAELSGRQYEFGLPFDFDEIKTRLLRALQADRAKRNGRTTAVSKIRSMKKKRANSSDEDSDSSLSSSSSSVIQSESRDSSEGDSTAARQVLEEADELLAEMTALMEGRGGAMDEAQSAELQQKLMALKMWSEELAMLAQGGGGSGGESSDSHSSSSSHGGRGNGRGRAGEFVLTIPEGEKRRPSEDSNSSSLQEGGGLRRRFSQTEETARESEEGGRGGKAHGRETRRFSSSSEEDLSDGSVESSVSGVRAGEEEGALRGSREGGRRRRREGRSEKSAGKEKGKETGGGKERDRDHQVGEKVMEVLQDLAVAGLEVRVKRWRAPMAIVKPSDANRDGTLPLRARFCLWPWTSICWSSVQRSLLVIRIFKQKAIAEMSDQTLLTEALTFASKVLLCLCLVLFLNLGTVLVGETDERHTNRRPAEVNTAPSSFGLEGYGDLGAFAFASSVKSLIVFVAVELLFALFMSPALSSIWSPEKTCSRVETAQLLWKRRRDGKEGTKGERENLNEKEEGEKGRERRVSVLAQPPEGLRGVEYFRFGPALSPSADKAQVPSWLSARVYVRCRAHEVFAQRCLLCLSIFLFCLLMVLFLSIGFSSEFFPLRHKQFVLREYLLCNLFICSFSVGFPALWGFLQGILV
eukprot:Cvel_23213.t1-p1 / transcript=Cvel_23213.t1 / gene=Cvel_23213 / organism=Chromera_velia_CCMP2878 / gene_product=Fibrillin-1, putative / transcript_product=Fibrillin-1, putative / location=Cvel_scaffold2367:813-9132(-) / protein_length=1779 / sequence_SO=supercontig / SO=protein_coding / is_pseudo=false